MTTQKSDVGKVIREKNGRQSHAGFCREEKHRVYQGEKGSTQKRKGKLFSSFGEYPKVEKKNSKQTLTDKTKHNFDTDFKGTQNVNQKP